MQARVAQLPSTINALQKFLSNVNANDLPNNSQLLLAGKNLVVEDIKLIADALKSGKCTRGLQIYIPNTGIDIESLSELASALESGNCPIGLELHLADNNIGVEGVIIIANALKSGKCPRDLKLYLGRNEIGDEGAKALAAAIRDADQPQGLELYLWHNKISVEGADAIAEALCSNTSVTLLELGTDFPSHESMHTIELCCARNDLLEKYSHHPELVYEIKRISNEAGFNLPSTSKKMLQPNFQFTLSLFNSRDNNKVVHELAMQDKQFHDFVSGIYDVINLCHQFNTSTLKRS